jgi:holo-[acyl-carrier protein] synthase
VALAVSVLGVGMDLVDIGRVARLLERKGDRALARLLTERERAYIATRADPAPHVAARIAAKEAVYKALQQLPGARRVGWRDIEVRRADEGRPDIELHGLAAALAAGARVHLSLTHSGTVAGAFAVLER